MLVTEGLETVAQGGSIDEGEREKASLENGKVKVITGMVVYVTSLIGANNPRYQQTNRRLYHIVMYSVWKSMDYTSLCDEANENMLKLLKKQVTSWF